MDPAQCREKMGKLITEESTGLAKLIELLEHEHGLLVAGDAVALGAPSTSASAVSARIARVDDERRAMCRARNLTSTPRGWRACCAGVIPAGTLSTPLGRMRRRGQSLPHAQ